MRAMISGPARGTITVADLEVGTLFRVASALSERLFVKCGNGLSTYSRTHGRKGGLKIKGANSAQPPVFAIVVPTTDRFDGRAFTPASNKIEATTPVAATYGILSLGN